MRVLLRCSAALALAGSGAWAQSSAPAIASVVNEASLAAGPIAPGMLVLVNGSNMANSTLLCNTTTPIPAVCNGVSVLVNGKAAPVHSVFATQVDFQVPFEIAGTSATIQVTNQTGGQTLESAPFTVAVAPTSPGLATADGIGSGVGLFYSVSKVQITASNLANPGDTVEAVGIGFGVTNPVVADGTTAAPPALVVAKVTVTVGGENAAVLSATMGYPGQYDVNFTLPADLPGGNLPLAMNVGGVNTQAGVVIPVTGPPKVTGVSNDASGALTVAGGSWVSIYGSNLSSTTRPWQTSDFFGIDMPLSLNGVSVKIDGQPAAVSYISPTQINVQAPSDTATGAVQVVVTTSLGTSAGTVTLEPYAPGFFQGSKYVAAQHADYTYVAPVGYYGSGTASRPATPGETVLLYGTGFGPTTPAVAAGQIYCCAAPLTDPTQLHVTIGGVPATVSWAGIVVAGEYQINVVIPPLADGDQSIAATIGGVSTQNGLLIPVKN